MGNAFSCFSSKPKPAPRTDTPETPHGNGTSRRLSSTSHQPVYPPVNQPQQPVVPVQPTAPPRPSSSRHPSEAKFQAGCMMRAIFPFIAENKSEISLIKGEVYILVDGSVDEWSIVRPMNASEEGYVPATYLQLADLPMDPDWYFGFMERITAVRILQDNHHTVGNFIIRKTNSRPNGYALSLRCKQDPNEVGAIKHYIISVDDAGKCYINDKSRFNIMDEFIDYYTSHCGGLDVALVAPCQKEIPPIPNRTRRDLRSIYCIDIQQIKFQQGQLGKGNFGEVFRATIRNRPVAVKTLNTNTEANRSNFLREAEAMNKYRHPNLVEFICMSFDETNNKLYLVSEFMSRGDLSKFLSNRRRTQEPTHLNYMLKIGQQVLDGMCYLEKYQVVHRDLRAANVLVGDGDIFKISDFGLLIDRSTVDYTSKFPIRWTAPEAMRDVKMFSTKSDVWSYGLLMIEVTSLGIQPYPELGSFKEVQNYVLKERKVHPKPSGCPQRLYDILYHCWNFDPMKRPTFEGLKYTIEQNLLDKDGHYSED